MPAPIPKQQETSDAHLLVCPRCERNKIALGSLGLLSGNGLPRCSEDGLALVETRELVESNYDTLLGRTIAGRFTIVAQLGRGSMGAVYRARQDAVGRDVALKILRPDRGASQETRARFEREARAISALTSPYTVTAFDFGEDEDGSWYLAMEMLHGETVGERLRRDGRFAWSDALQFGRDALLSLAEAHETGIIHRDLKPDNLFLSRSAPDGSGQVREVCKVLDFGIAKALRGDLQPLDGLETQAGTVFGTPRYMAPEQAQGLSLDGRSDLYSLGVLLYHMITGRAPFVDDDAVVVMARHIKDEPARFATALPGLSVPEAVENVVFRALQKQPRDRPANAREFIELIDSAVQHAHAADSGVRVLKTPLPTRARPARRWISIGIGIGLLALIGIGLFASGGQTPRSESQKPATVTAPSENAEQVVPARLTHLDISKNSAVSAAATLPTLPSSAKPRKAPPRRGGPTTLPLERRGNERYGRFE